MARLSILLMLSAVALSSAAHADVSISNKPTQNMDCQSGVCTATAQKAVLNVNDLTNMLASGDTTVKTGTAAKDIGIGQSLTWSTTSRLTLDAQQSVIVKKQITVASQGALTITTNDGGSGGDLYFFGKGNVTFFDLASSLIVSGLDYKLVSTLSSLANEIAQNPAGAYALARSYDASSEVFHKAAITKTFIGNFEGLGNSISNIKVSHGFQDCAGTFAQTGASVIRDIVLKKLHVSSRVAAHVGGLVGCGGGTIVNAFVEGKIVANSPDVDDAGGLVGRNTGLVQRSRASVSVETLGEDSGGLVGENRGRVESSFTTGSVQGGYGGGGGVVGFNDSIISNCYSLTMIEGDNSDIGGLVGISDGPVDHSFSAGAVEAAGNIAGGFVGFDGDVVMNSYWDMDTSGISDPSQGAGNTPNDPGITGLTDAQLKSGLPEGFDPKLWGSSPNINNGYPYLLANPPQ